MKRILIILLILTVVIGTGVAINFFPTPKTYSVAEFAALTYLTEFGVQQWLKQGRISGRQVSGGEWQVDAANLEVPDVKRLVRQ